MHFFTKIEIIMILLIMLAFFLPWLHFEGQADLYGYQIPIILILLNILATDNAEISFNINYLYILLYLPLIFGFLAIILGLIRKNFRIMAFLTAIIPILGLIVLFFHLKLNIANILYGGWITLIAAISLLLVILNTKFSIKPSEK